MGRIKLLPTNRCPNQRAKQMNVDNLTPKSNASSKLFKLTRFRFLSHVEIVCFDCGTKIKWRHPFMTRKLAWWLLDRKCERNEQKQWKQQLKEQK